MHMHLSFKSHSVIGQSQHPKVMVSANLYIKEIQNIGGLACPPSSPSLSYEFTSSMKE